MKGIIWITVMLGMLLGLSMNASAADFGEDKLIQQLPGQVEEQLSELGIDEIQPEDITGFGPFDAIAYAWKSMADRARMPLVLLATIVGISILMGICNAIGESFSNKALLPVLNTVSVIAALVAGGTPIVEFIRRMAQTLEQSGNFIMGYIPVFAAATAAGGQITTAKAYGSVLFIVAQIVGTAASKSIVPALCVYLGFCMISGVFPNVTIQSLAQTVKNITISILTGGATLFIAVLTLQTIVTSAADSVAMRSVKFLIGSAVPVVGVALSEAANTVSGYIGLIKSTIGGFGIIAVLIAFIPPILECLLWSVSLSLGAAVSEMFCASAMAGVLRSVKSVLQIMMAILICFAVIVIISTALVIFMGKGGV